MQLRSLTIRTLPGIAPGFTFEPPDSGVTIVVGPNGSGKSSLARALKHLLVSEPSDPPAVSLDAEFDSPDGHWKVTRNGRQIVWWRDGEQASPPALPTADQIGRYRLSVENLLDAGDALDSDLAARLQRELHGNFDLGAVHRALAVRPRHGSTEAKALAGAGQALHRVQSEYAALRQQEQRLPGLESRIAAALAARAHCDCLEQALKLTNAVDDVQKRIAALRGYPPQLDRLAGDELEQLDGWERKAAGLREGARSEERTRAAAAARLEETGLAQPGPADEDVRTTERWLVALREQRVKCSNIEEERAKTGAQLQAVLSQFNTGGDPPTLDAGAFERAAKVAQPLVAARTRQTELRERLALAGDSPDDAAIERCRAAAEALRAWLAAADAEGERTRQASRGWPLITSLAAAVAAVVAAAVEGALGALVAALIAAAASAFALFRRREQQQPPPTDAARRRFDELELTPPVGWDRPAVRRRLGEAETRLNQMTMQRDRALAVASLEHQLGETVQQIETLELEKSALAREIGFDPELPAVQFELFVRRCAEWNKAQVAHAQQSARLLKIEQQIVDGAGRVHEFLAAWRAEDDPELADPSGPVDIDRLDSAFDSLRKRIDAASDARRATSACDTTLQALRERIADAETQVRTLYARAGIELGDRPTLASHLEQLEDWKAASRALAGAKSVEAHLRAQLGEHPELVARVDAGQRDELKAALDASRLGADKYETLIGDRQDIVTSLDAAGGDRRLEQAAAKKQRAQQALEDKRDEALLAAAAAVLLHDVETAFVAQHEPVILQRARSLFAAVTAHDFDLELPRNGTFIARDRRQDAPRTLDELSSGTRMQLLLALRLAWAEAQEQGAGPLPLFLDEALTTSDEDRFAVVARSLERIAGAGNDRRQFFYLSARRHEPALWREATGTDPAVVDLAVVRFRSAALSPKQYHVELPPPVPAPCGESAEAYANRLGVPRIDPYQPPGGIHLFHLLRDDLTQLHTLMDTWRIATVGQLEGLLKSDAADDAAGGIERLRQLQQRARAVLIWVELWRQGRGQSVDRAALEQCTAISEVFIDRVADLAERLHGDGRELVAALRAGTVSRFHSSKTGEIEQWLADEGYIDDQERLTVNDRRRMTLQRVAPATETAVRDVNRVIDWLESAANWLEAATETGD